MPNDYPERGERAEKNTMRKDIEKATEKPKWCPTCGQKVGTSTAAVGGAGGGG
jgi:hypothetical protein